MCRSRAAVHIFGPALDYRAALAWWLYSHRHDLLRTAMDNLPFKAFVCAACGTLGGAIIGLDTEYLTSHSWAPARELSTTCSQSGCEQLACAGLQSRMVPGFVHESATVVPFSLCDCMALL